MLIILPTRLILKIFDKENTLSDGHPIYSPSAQLGGLGLEIVLRIVRHNFKWLLRPNHQEHDFGIDGQIDIIAEDNTVTGHMIGVQIKCGKSFFEEENRWGYVYRGERKHFNYLSNYPIPVIIVICDPATEECYWVEFDEEQTQLTGQNWKMTIPFENKLRLAKPKIEEMLPEVHDSLDRLAFYWAINNVMVDSGVIIMAVDREEIEELSTSSIRGSFDRLRSTKEIAFKAQGKVEFVFRGYEQDGRELFEIPEVRAYVHKLDRRLPELFFFARTKKPTDTLMTFLLCQARVGRVAVQLPEGVAINLRVEPQDIAEFLIRHFPGLNDMTSWVGMSADENKAITGAIIQCLSFQATP